MAKYSQRNSPRYGPGAGQPGQQSGSSIGPGLCPFCARDPSSPERGTATCPGCSQPISPALLQLIQSRRNQLPSWMDYMSYGYRVQNPDWNLFLLWWRAGKDWRTELPPGQQLRNQAGQSNPMPAKSSSWLGRAIYSK